MNLYELEKELTEDVKHIATKHGIDTTNLIVNIQTSKKAPGHYARNLWKDGELNRHEIALNPEYFNNPMELLDTMIHELVHMYCDQNGIKETSRNGSYHNKKFKEIAESFGLRCITDKTGWNTTAEGNTHLKYINNDLPFPLTDLMIRKSLDEKKTGQKNHSIKYVCPSCGISCRATKKINIKCIECDEVMEEEE